jgi:hypothetical protein
MWGTTAAAGSSSTVSVNWANSNFGADIEVSDTSSSTAYPPYVTTSPPKGTEASWWHLSSNTTALAYLNYPSGAIVDVDVELTLCDGDSPSTYAIASGLAGVVYYLSLDLVSHTLTPVSLTTTF